MNFAEQRRHIRIQTRNERNPRGTSHPRRADPRDRETEHERKRRGDPHNANSRRHVVDGLHNALQHIDIFADSDQQSERRAHIKETRQYSSPRNRARKSTAGVVDLVTHDRSKLKTHQPNTNHTERIQNETRIRWNLEVGGANTRPKSRPHHDTEADKHGGGNKSSNRPDIVDPLADTKSENIENGEQRKQRKRHYRSKCLVVGQPQMTRANHVDRYADKIEHYRRHIQHVIRPVTPAGEKSVKI